MMRLYRVYAARENEEDVFGVAAEKKERELLCKKTDPLHLCTHFTLKTLYKHKEVQVMWEEVKATDSSVQRFRQLKSFLGIQQ